MTFDLSTIAVFVGAALIYAALLPVKWREWALFVGSVVAIYWLQPVLPIRFSGFIFPTLILVITAVSHQLTQSQNTRRDAITALVLAGVVIALSLSRYFDVNYIFLANRPPNTLIVTGAVATVGILAAIGTHFVQPARREHLLPLAIVGLIGLFLLIKTEAAATAVSRIWRTQTGQDSSLASVVDLNWIGFSYVTFRLIHTLRDRQNGLLPDLSLREYITYIIFFPAFIAGPIDRAERLVTDLRALPTLTGLDAARIYAGLQRIGWGLFKKFVIADLLAQGMALTGTNATQIQSTSGLWLLLYGYGFRLYFDFSGYTDIAIGIGLLLGLKLPENFQRPYLTTNITTFWQSWHITLSDWVRFYVFSPLSRSLLRRKPKPSPTLIVFTTQLATMIVIGLWHGISWSFLIWGVWHGLGLFIHKQWSGKTRRLYRRIQKTAWQRRAWTAAAWFVTFHFVMLGWVWFALPDVTQAAHTMGRLFGVGL